MAITTCEPVTSSFGPDATKAAVGVALIIPCYNEASRLGDTLREVAAFCGQSGLSCQVVLVDDGSTDSTRDVIMQGARDYPFVLPVILPQNRGKGAALVQGVMASTGETVVFFDADLSYPLDTILTALRELQAGADVVIGARDLGAAAAASSRPSFVRRITHFAFSAMVDHYVHLGIPDTQGGFKAFRGPVARALFTRLTIDRFAFDVELLALARLWGLTIRRIPLDATRREGSSVRLFHDSIEMWRALVQIRRRVRSGNYPAAMPDASCPAHAPKSCEGTDDE